MKRTSNKKETFGQRTELLINIINDVKKMPFVEFCFIFSINPIGKQVHGDILSWIKGVDEIKSNRTKAVPPWLKDIIENRMGDGTFFETNSPNIFDFVDEALGSDKKKIFVPFLTENEDAALALLFIGYEIVPAQFEHHVDGLVKHYRPLLESTWLLGRYKVIAEAGRKINESLKSHKAIFDELLEKISSVLDTSYYFLMGVYIPQADVFDKYFYYKYSDTEDKKDHKSQVFSPAAKLALDKKRVVVTFDFDEDVKNVEDLQKFQFDQDERPNPKSIIYVPLFLRDELLGVLSVQQENAQALNWEDVRILELLGNQVSLALNSIRLYKYLEDINLAGAQLISPLSQMKNSAERRKGFLSKIVKTIQISSKADNVILFPYSESPSKSLSDKFERVRVSGRLLKRHKESLKIATDDHIACLILKKFIIDKFYPGEYAENSETLYADLDGPPHRKGSFEKDEKIVSTAALSLKINNDFVGVLFLNFRKPQKFEGLQKLHIATLAQYASLSIRIQKDILVSKKKSLEALQKIDKLIGKEQKFEDVIQGILDIAVEDSNAHDSAIYLFNPVDGKLHPQAVNGPNRETYDQMPILINGKGLVPKAYNTGVAQLENDVQNNKDYSRIIERTKSELDVPLIHPQSGKVIGVINLESTDSPAFHEEDEVFLTSIASQAALAIKIAEAKKYASDLGERIGSTIKTAFNIIAKKSEPKKEITKILDRARELTGAEMAILQLYQNGTPTDSFTSRIKKDGSPEIDKLYDIEPHKEELGVIQWVADKKYYKLIKNTDRSKVYRGSDLIKSELAVPLKIKDHLYAVLDVESHRYSAFNREHVKLLEEFAVIAVLVTQTANRALEAQHKIDRETRRFIILDNAMLALNRTNFSELPPPIKAANQEKLFDIVIQALKDFKNEGEMIIRSFDREKNSFELVKLENQHQKEVPKSIPYYSTNGELGSINAQAAQLRATIYEPDLDNRTPKTVRPFSDPRIKCIIVVPIWSGPNYFGNLVWSHTKKNFFDKSDILLVEGLGAQLGGALALLEGAGRSEELETMSRSVELVAEISHTLGSTFVPIEENLSTIMEAASEQIQLSQELQECEAGIREAVGELREMLEDLREKLLSSNSEVDYYKIEEFIPSIGNLVSCPEGVRIEYEFTALEGWVRVDIKEIVEIVKHLLKNALGVLNKGTIKVNIYKEFHELIIDVSDNGPGVLKEIAPLIFEFGFSTVKTSGKKSTGLGLWTSRRKARRNAGKLTLVDDEKNGATFRLGLPIYDNPDESNNERGN